MTKSCHIKGCVAVDRSKLSVFSVPYQLELQQKWIEAIETHQDFNYKLFKFMICELHFDAKDLFHGQSRTHLRRGAIPTKFPANYCEVRLDPDKVEQYESNRKNPSYLPNPIESIKKEKDAGLKTVATEVKVNKSLPITSDSTVAKNPIKALPVTRKRPAPVIAARVPAAKIVAKVTAKPVDIVAIEMPKLSEKVRTKTVESQRNKITSRGRVSKPSERLRESSYFVKPIKQEKTDDVQPISTNQPISDSLLKPIQITAPQFKPPQLKSPPTVSIPTKTTVFKRPLTTVVSKRPQTAVVSKQFISQLTSKKPNPIGSIGKIVNVSSLLVRKTPQTSNTPQTLHTVPRGSLQRDTVTISRAFFVKLSKASVQLAKAEETISKLTASNIEKDKEIEKLKILLAAAERATQDNSLLMQIAPPRKRK